MTRLASCGIGYHRVRRLGVFGVALVAGPLNAQTTIASPARLSVRPATMATGTTNPAAGRYPLDSLPNISDRMRTDPYTIYVPPACVGAHRCPLLLVLHGAGMTSQGPLAFFSSVADSNVFILLAATAVTDFWYGVKDSADAAPDWANLDAALQQTLRKFAIDPDKIAILGRCNGGWGANPLGAANPDVFNRIVAVSGGDWREVELGPRPANRTSEMLLDEQIDDPVRVMEDAQTLRRLGYPVKVVLPLRGHGDQAEDYAYVGRWLAESWAKSSPADRSAPQTIDSLPVLTPEAMDKLKKFWDDMAKIDLTPDQRIPYLHEILLPVGRGADQPSIWIMDMAAVAARYPAVAVALEEAKLSPHEHDAYRVALLSAALVGGIPELRQPVEAVLGPVDPTSILGRNRTFLEAHQDELDMSASVGPFKTP